MPPPYLHSFFVSCYGDHRDLHSFPTRRSSDLRLSLHRSQEPVWPPCRRARQAPAGRHARLGHPEGAWRARSEEHTSELQSRENLVCRLLLEKKNDAHPRKCLVPSRTKRRPTRV